MIVQNDGGFPTGEVVIAVAAVIAAGLAALTAQWRLRAQLDHDRDMRDRDELRGRLDSAALEVDALARVLLRADSHAHLERMEGTTEGVAAGRAIAEAQIDQASDLIAQLAPTNSRLKIRLPPEHPIVTSHWAIREPMFDWLFAIGAVLGADMDDVVQGTAGALGDEQHQQVAEAKERTRDTGVQAMYEVRVTAGGALQAFISNCRAYLHPPD